MSLRLPICLSVIAGLALGASLLPAAEAPASPRVVKLRAGVDNAMKFDLATIPAAPGELLRVVLSNASTFPKNVMGHNWVLLAAGSDVAAFSAAAAPEAASGYIPAKWKDKILAVIGLLGPNEVGEVTFTAPGAPGEYPFVCSFPGHGVVGMKGMLVVRR
ncbi:MAG: azurin [Verrucomicrobia bacterium]|nr:azurin [Verrucomicrobiota bacterium]